MSHNDTFKPFVEHWIPLDDLQKNWDDGVDKEGNEGHDLWVLKEVVKLGKELSHYKRPRTDRDSEESFIWAWKIRPEAQHRHYVVQFIYPTNILHVKNRTDAFVTIDAVHISPFSIENYYDAEIHRQIVNVTVNMHNKPIAVESWTTFWKTQHTVTHPNSAGMSVQKTRNGAIVSAIDSPRQSKKRRLEDQ